MKVVILAGGFGTRLSEETRLKPKPMVEIGEKPMIWHVMKIYADHGFTDFIICLGYKGYIIKEYFANYFLHQNDVTFDLSNNQLTYHHSEMAEPWKVTLVDTGINTMTGGRIKRIRKFIGDEDFMLTYGDGVGDVNITELVQFHKKNDKELTVTAVQPSGRFGAMNIKENNEVLSFLEKPKGERGWINGGFFVCKPEVIDYIDNDATTWEKEPMERITEKNELVAYKHHGYWQCMDTLRDKNTLEKLWEEKIAPWATWLQNKLVK